MKKKLIALMLCLMQAFACGLCEDAPVAPPVQAPIPEAEAVALMPEAAQEAAFAVEAPEDAEPEATAAPEAEAADGSQPAAAPTATPEPALEEKTFSKTKTVKTKTYKRVNLVRSEGFTGALAQVEGTLTLKDAEIEGVPARQASLLKAFSLGPTGNIVIKDDALLTADVAAFSFNKGDVRKLSVTYKGKALSAKRVKWTMSKKGIVKISAAGKVTALKKGKVTLTGAYKGQKLKCAVVVTDIVRVQDIALSAKTQTVGLYRTEKLKAQLSPANTTEKAVKWKSSNKAVATVTAKGEVAGLSEGTATITATAANGKKAKCKVTVKAIEPTGVSFTNLYAVAALGDTATLGVAFAPDNCSYTDVTFKSGDKSIAKVDKDTGEVTPVARGWTTITATSARDPKLSATCRLCVVKADAKRLAGLVIGINPGHQRQTISKQYPMAPGSSKKGYGVKTGACGHWTRVNEYETVLAVGLKLRDKLEKLGATVVMTRTDNDVMLTNIDRAKMLNEAEVDIALQLHCDAVDNPRMEGCAAYYRNSGDWLPESRACAKALADAISAGTGCKNNGSKVYNDYMSLNWSETPAILIEMGFISNQKEDKLLATDAYRDKMADAIADGLCAHFGR